MISEKQKWAVSVAVENLGRIARKITARLMSDAGSGMAIWCRGDISIGNGRVTVSRLLTSTLKQNRDRCDLFIPAKAMVAKRKSWIIL
jgi:hypothetical protein